jgi:hypothetical protein
MSAYTIDYTDPLLNEFIIQPGGFDGPGGSSTHSTLRLYGRGTLEWGESVDEDLLRLAESFAGSTAPHNPIGGQLWFQTIFYWHNTTAGGDAYGWHAYNPNTKLWASMGTTIPAGTGPLPAIPTIGDYYYLTAPYGGSAAGLYRYDQAYKQESATWLSRLFTTATTAPGSAVPVQNLKVYDAYGAAGVGQWVSPITTAVQSSAPANPHQGDLFYNTTTGHLQVYTGAAWQDILGPTFGTATDANNNAIANLNITTPLVQGTDGTPTPASTNRNATDKTYVDAQDSHWGAFTASHYVPIAGTGAIPITGAIVSNSSIQANSFVLPNGGTMTLNVTSSINVNSQRITNLTNTPSALTDAVNANYVNTQIATQAATDQTLYINAAGDTMSGILYLGATGTAAQLQAGAQFNVNSQRITNITNSPTALTDAVNGNYVNTQISSAINAALGSNVPVIYTSLGAAKNGDIGIVGSTIYMYAGGGWRKIFPAQWV